MDRHPFLLRQIESRKKSETAARKKAADQEKAKAVAKAAAKRPGGSTDTPEAKRPTLADDGWGSNFHCHAQHAAALTPCTHAQARSGARRSCAPSPTQSCRTS